MKLTQFYLKQIPWSGEQPVLLDGRPYYLYFDIYGSLVHGRYQFEKEGCQYCLEFDLEEMYLEGEGSSQLLTLLLRGVPRVKAEGSLIRELGSSLVNVVGRFLDLESVYSTSVVKIPGLMVRNNDLLYQFQPGQAPWWIRLVLWVGIVIRLVPEGERLRVEIHYRRDSW